MTELERMDSPEELLYERRPLARAEHIPVALHRFAAPSGPWPWSSGPSSTTSIPSLSTARKITPNGQLPSMLEDWLGYPQSYFPNWTAEVTSRSGIQVLLNREPSKETAVFTLDVLHTGNFVMRPSLRESEVLNIWNELSSPVRSGGRCSARLISNSQRRDGITVRCIFVGDLCGSLLQMLGARYGIEPFVFSSAINGIPSRYQEDNDEDGGDRACFSRAHDLFLTGLTH